MAIKEVKGFGFIDRLRLFLGGELSQLVGWILPTVKGDSGCDDPPEWIIYGKASWDIIYSCTLHLSDIVSDSTVRVDPYKPEGPHLAQKTCCYLYSTEEEPEDHAGANDRCAGK